MNRNNFLFKTKKIDLQSKVEFPELFVSSAKEDSCDSLYKKVLVKKNKLDAKSYERKKGWVYIDKNTPKIEEEEEENADENDAFFHEKACKVMQRLVNYLEKRKNEYIDTHGIDDYIKNFGDYVVEEEDDYEDFYDDYANNQDQADDYE